MASMIIDIERETRRGGDTSKGALDKILSVDGGQNLGDIQRVV